MINLTNIYGCRCGTIICCRGCVWCDIWTGICKPLAATLQAGHLGRRGEVFGVVGAQNRRTVLNAKMNGCLRLVSQVIIKNRSA